MGEVKWVEVTEADYQVRTLGKADDQEMGGLNLFIRMSSDVKQEIKSEPVGEMATEPASADAILDNLFKTITEKSVRQEPETSEGEEDSEEDSEDEVSCQWKFILLISTSTLFFSCAVLL